MKKTFALVLSLILLGCSASSLQNGEPVFSGHSSKTASQVNKCLAPKWQDLHPQANSIETEQGYKISAADDLFGVLSIAIINNDGSGGANINVYAASKGIGNPWGNTAKSCI
ncbi:hypothetical protein [Enterobacter roggenkampii]|uniref:hypothetical protein n=1 Tax=Enterobacter roggenkampii TaxID=1812935 RepID=UPI000DCF51BB|nr:hypothetical protein [Enterobacter roggenkampii]RAY75228.1 hypothetical protein DP179_14220 [Enterobacter roggenkampii]